MSTNEAVMPEESVMVKLLDMATVVPSPSYGLYMIAPEIMTPMDPSGALVVSVEYSGVDGMSKEYSWAEVGSLMMWAVEASGTTTPAFGTA